MVGAGLPAGRREAAWQALLAGRWLPAPMQPSEGLRHPREAGPVRAWSRTGAGGGGRCEEQPTSEYPLTPVPWRLSRVRRRAGPAALSRCVLDRRSVMAERRSRVLLPYRRVPRGPNSRRPPPARGVSMEPRAAVTAAPVEQSVVAAAIYRDGRRVD